jgi:hypothetical protein
MKTAATKLDDADVMELAGTVLRVEGRVLVVGTQRGEVRAHRAVSCLVEPLLHDFVLVAAFAKADRGSGHTLTGYVLAVLERETSEVRLVADGDVDWTVREGRFRVVSRDGVDLVSPKEVQIVSQEIGLSATTAKLVARDIVAIGASVLGELVDVKLRGTFLDKVFERVSERVDRSFRRVAEIDQLKARQIDHLAEETLSLRSANAVVTAEDLVKVDGDQIHLG